MPIRLNLSSSSFAEEFIEFLNIKRESQASIEKVVAKILENIRINGDEALFNYTSRFDRHQLAPNNISISPQEINQALRACDQEQLKSLKLAEKRIRDFHEKQLPSDLDYKDDVGVKLGLKWNPIEAVGIYTPGGSASYPSSVLMNSIPAKVAGVKRLAMVVPTPEGVINPLVLAAASISGVDEIYKVGGAQAIGALAYGCDSIKAVDKIVGPGNAYVAMAKRQVFGIVGIDMIAGPSEILIVADNKNDPSWIAADLLAQAEHDISAQAILLTDDNKFADQVCEAIDIKLSYLSRGKIASESWKKYGAIIILENMLQATELINRIAPEHLELAIEEPNSLTFNGINAGAVFIGRYAPEALGDYIGGPNHVLPTGRSARYSSGLGVIDFMKRTSFMDVSAKAIEAIGPAAISLAEAEGLEAHADSVKLRLLDTDSDPM
jgi:histidinol dehydrogenase